MNKDLSLYGHFANFLSKFLRGSYHSITLRDKVAEDFCKDPVKRAAITEFATANDVKIILSLELEHTSGLDLQLINCVYAINFDYVGDVSKLTKITVLSIQEGACPIGISCLTNLKELDIGGLEHVLNKMLKIEDMNVIGKLQVLKINAQLIKDTMLCTLKNVQDLTLRN